MRVGLGFILFMLAAGGCASSYEDEYDPDQQEYRGGDARPSSLFEVNFGNGDPEVTKNLPADAANYVGDKVRSARDD